MEHGRAMALVGAMMHADVIEGIGDRESNPVFMEAFRVAFPDYPGTDKTWPYQRQRFDSRPHVRSIYADHIEARKKLGAMIEEWGKAIQDCEEGLQP
jgi:phage tail protein X